jgi:thiol-disulfide isomerase/thioredoxin
MKTFLLLLSLLSSVFAYELGSSVDEKVLNALNINDNRIYIVDFFASWCHSCEEEIPDLNDLNRNLDKTKYELIGVAIDKDIAKAEAFQKYLDINFRVINDNEHKIVSIFKPIGMPSLYIIKDKKVFHIMVGAVDDIDEVISNYLGIQND